MEFKTIPFQGIGNARELGGYRVGDRTVKEGMLVRAGAMSRASKEDLELLRQRYRIGTVIDLRMTSEFVSEKDPEVAGAVNYHIPVLEMKDMTADVDPKLVERFANAELDRMEIFRLSYEHGFLNDDLYVRFLLDPRGLRGWKEFFARMLENGEDRGFLWHCTDGKDRTGCGAMLILSALGTDRETILRDYMQTNVQNAERQAKVLKQVEPLHMPENQLKALLFISGGVAESYMTKALDALTANYGSVSGYLDELGVGPDAREELRRRYLV